MKVITIISALLAIALAAPPQSGDKDAAVIRQESDNIGLGDYSYAYETSNGISASEQGQLKQSGKEEALSVRGQFSYTAPDGQVYTVTYIADENGFQPQGNHLPQ